MLHPYPHHSKITVLVLKKKKVKNSPVGSGDCYKVSFEMVCVHPLLKAFDVSQSMGLVGETSSKGVGVFLREISLEKSPTYVKVRRNSQL